VKLTITRLRLAVLIAAAAGGGFWIGRASTEETTTRSPTTAETARKLIVDLDNAQLCHWKAHGRYGGDIADLEETMWRLDPWSGGGGLTARASGYGLSLAIHASRDGRFYNDRITGDGVDVYMSRSSGGSIDYGGDIPNRDHAVCVKRP
jgi:hypothetical protein